MRHPGRWFAVTFVGVLGVLWFLSRTFGAEAVGRVILVLAIPGTLASVIAKERQQGARLSVTTVVVALAAASFNAWLWGWSDSSWWVKVVLTSLVFGPLASMANAAVRADGRRGQQRRDVAAMDIEHRAIAGAETGPYVLYLRPFVTTDRLAAQPVGDSIGDTSVPVHLDVEALLDRAVRGRWPLIALGRSGDVTQGAARVETSDDEWMSIVAALATRALLIVMVPLARTGTTWELGWLADHDLLGKTVMIMPETVAPTPSGAVSTTEGDRVFDAGIRRWNQEEHQLDLFAEWGAAQVAAADLGIRLPPLATVGALFTIDPGTRRVARIMPLGLSTIARRVRYVRDAIADLGLLPDPPRPPTDPLATYRSGVWYRGRTLAYALVRAADGFLVWADAPTAVAFLRCGLDEEPGGRRVTADYLQQLPALIDERTRLGDRDATANYRAGLPVLLDDPHLSTLAPPELRTLSTPPDDDAARL